MPINLATKIKTKIKQIPNIKIYLLTKSNIKANVQQIAQITQITLKIATKAEVESKNIIVSKKHQKKLIFLLLISCNLLSIHV